MGWWLQGVLAIALASADALLSADLRDFGCFGIVNGGDGCWDMHWRRVYYLFYIQCSNDHYLSLAEKKAARKQAEQKNSFTIMQVQAIKKRIDQGESERLEMKLSTGQGTEAAKTVCGTLNRHPQ